MFKIPKKVIKVSNLETRDIIARGLKLGEEYGELSAEILKITGHKGNNNKSKKQILSALHLEAVDCLLMSMDILIYTGASNKIINSIMDRQLSKWYKSFKSRK